MNNFIGNTESQAELVSNKAFEVYNELSKSNNFDYIYFQLYPKDSIEGTKILEYLASFFSLAGLKKSSFYIDYFEQRKLAEQDLFIIECIIKIKQINDQELKNLFKIISLDEYKPSNKPFNASVFLISLNEGIIFYLYDDRGLDIVSLNKQSLKPIYERFKDWLLDYDIDRMKETFEI